MSKNTCIGNPIAAKQALPQIVAKETKQRNPLGKSPLCAKCNAGNKPAKLKITNKAKSASQQFTWNWTQYFIEMKHQI